MKRLSFALNLIAILAFWLAFPYSIWAKEVSLPLSALSSDDAFLVAGPDGKILYRQNEKKRYVPASTLKILTALAAIHYLGRSYRFKTEFYLDCKQNLKVKGYGDPLLISEVWQGIALELASRISGFKDLLLDDTYFSRDISIPGATDSTNPYDAPIGALCANFNTVYFKHNEKGKIVSAEPQTPMTSLALRKIRLLGLKRGRYTFTHERNETPRYAGELLAYFLGKGGMNFSGDIRFGVVGEKDRLLYTYRSAFSLEEALRKMLEFSSNFMANQVLVTLGAALHGPPGTLEKGVRSLSDYCKEILHLKDTKVVEGSGISRQNSMSAMDMLTVLKAFEIHRDLLGRQGSILYKSGTLKDIRTRAGYMEFEGGKIYYFVIFLKDSNADITSVLSALRKRLSAHRKEATVQ
ncbi:MAG: D-alanyl-D-alanine carboxypeptidase [Deltaproteobacteria bacterium]|nr:D-alanyl-D-alanine carboxypeptidase [Deltaproteobacteria bacterium]